MGSNIFDLEKREKELREELKDIQVSLATMRSLRDRDPIDYLGRMIYEEKKVYGSYGYTYGEYGQAEKERAQKVLDTAGGDITIAERIITELRVQ